MTLLESYFINRKKHGSASTAMKGDLFSNIDKDIEDFYNEAEIWFEEGSNISFGVADMFQSIVLVFWNMEQLSLVTY